MVDYQINSACTYAEVVNVEGYLLPTSSHFGLFPCRSDTNTGMNCFQTLPFGNAFNDSASMRNSKLNALVLNFIGTQKMGGDIYIKIY